MTNKIIIVIVLILIIGGLGYWTYEFDIIPSRELSPKAPAGKIEAPEETGENFFETGNIVNNNPGLKENVWYLSYEKPGSPGLAVELIFTEETKCIIGEKEENCASVDFENGEKVKIKGIKKDNSVLVEELTKL